MLRLFTPSGCTITLCFADWTWYWFTVSGTITFPEVRDLTVLKYFGGKGPCTAVAPVGVLEFLIVCSNMSLFLIKVCHLIIDDTVTDDADVLEVHGLVLEQGYSLKFEDPDVFDDSLDLDRFTPCREWPGQSFLVRSAGEVTSSSIKASTGGVPDDLIAAMIAIHHSHADLLKTFKVDACALYKAKQKAVFILEVLPEELQVSDLRVHQHTFHADEGTLKDKKIFQCDVCKKTFGEAYTLKRHMLIHQDSRNQHWCGQCQQSFTTPSRLNEHKKHHQGKVSCEWCRKQFMDPKGLKEHHQRCQQHLGALKDIPCPHKCHQCGKGSHKTRTC